MKESKNIQFPLDESQMLHEMELMKDPVLNNIRILKPYNLLDKYYRRIMKLAKADYFFETYMVIYWAGVKFHPKRIFEIGTRNGGSLVQLLSTYQDYSDVSVVSFDLWREIGSPRKVKKNLKRMNIPTGMIEFHSGNSLETVPKYKSENPEAQFDYVLVDGGHERDIARQDLENVVDIVAPGGILIFDDIGPESYKLGDVWEAFKKKHHDKFYWYEKYWRKGVAWAFRKHE